MIEHPDINTYRQAIAACAALEGTFKGRLFRSCTAKYATEKDLLTGDGSFKFGGRWNAPNRFRVVYLSLSLEGSLAESIGATTSYGIDPTQCLPLTSVVLDADLNRTLDLTLPAIRKLLGISLASMNGCDWELDNRANREAMTQAVGRAACEAGLQGIVVPSVCKRTFRHLNVFPQNLTSVKQQLQIINAGNLPK